MKITTEIAEAPVAFTINTNQSACPALAADQKHKAPELIDAVCVDIKDLGAVATTYGDKEQIKFIFETEGNGETQETRTLTRIFNNYIYDASHLTLYVKSWTGRDLVAERQQGRVNLKSLVGQKARLRLEPVLTKSGSTFDKIVEILPAK